MSTVVPFTDLAGRDEVRRWEGRDHGGTTSGFLVLAMPPGGGPGLHTHPYDETFVVLEGKAVFTAGDETVEAEAGLIVVVPGDTPHKFVNSGDGVLRMVTIHANDHLIQDDLPEDG